MLSGSDSEEGRGRPKTALNWENPEDPASPQNWSIRRKYFQIVTAGCVAFISTLASSIFTPGLDKAAQDFNVGEELGVFAFSIYILGLGLGGSIASPLSETFGRKWIYMTSIPLFALSVLGTGFANNIVALLFLRFLAGLFGAPSVSIGSASVSDMFPPEQRSRPMILFISTPYLGPTLGPLIGGFVITARGWRWTSWTVLFGVVLIIGPALCLRETYKKTILQKRARHLNIEGPPSIHAGRSRAEVISYFVRSTLIRPLHMLFTEPVVAAFCLFVGYNFALSYSFFAAFQYVYETFYDFSLNQTGLTFAGLTIGCLMSAVIMDLVHNFVYLPKLRQHIEGESNKSAGAGTTSKIAPEHRLYNAMIGGPMLAIGLFLFGWTAAYRVHWIVPVIAEAFFGCGNQLVFMTSSMYIMDVYGPLFGASAMAANTLLRYVLAAAFPLFSVQMFRGLGPQWACTLLGCLSIFGAFVPFVLFQWGPAFRARSKYARGD